MLFSIFISTRKIKCYDLFILMQLRPPHLRVNSANHGVKSIALPKDF